MAFSGRPDLSGDVCYIQQRFPPEDEIILEGTMEKMCAEDRYACTSSDFFTTIFKYQSIYYYIFEMFPRN